MRFNILLNKIIKISNIFLSRACEEVLPHFACRWDSIMIHVLSLYYGTQSELTKLGWRARLIQVYKTFLVHLSLALWVKFSLSFRRRMVLVMFYRIPTMLGHLTEFFYKLSKLQGWNPLMVFDLQDPANLWYKLLPKPTI